jgi:DNA topoisomerase II
MAKKIEYVEMDPLEHCLLRPDTYIGGIRNQERSEWVIEGEQLVYKTILGNTGLERLFIEAQSNAIDNLWRSTEAECKQTMIAFEIDKETGWTSVSNDGLVIDITEKHESGLWKPEFIFGRLRTSSNYNDTEERKTSGKNGLGIKLTNIYSMECKVEVVDKDSALRYEQSWSNHMKQKADAVVQTLKKTHLSKYKTSFTKVSWRPDFTYFSLEKYNDDLIALFMRYACDTAMITGLKVTMNQAAVPFVNMKSYIKALQCTESLLLESADCKVAVCSSNEFRHLSFVNGCFTAEGGAHVDAWVHEVLKPVQEKIEQKLKIKYSLRDLKKYFTFIVIANVVRPEFTSQTKQCYVSPNVKTVVEDKHIQAIVKWEFMKQVSDEAKMKEMSSLKKTEKRGYTKVEGLDPANFSGGAKSKDCILVICEGESAKTYTVAGLDVGIQGKIGRDYIGIYPIRGKILNSRNATLTQIQDNREITGIRQALGLQHGLDYKLEENYKKLRYGKVVVISDADTDGKHITGLILNVFHSLYPSLIERGDFLFSMRTPIMTVTVGKSERDMYSSYEHEEFVKTLTKAQLNSMKIKWRKGLGSSKRDEVKKSFGQRMVKFNPDKECDANLIKAFDKKFADQRKTWMMEYLPSQEVLPMEEKTELQPISHFVNQEFITFSMEDCSRSLPHVMDGLKESQRKVLYTCFKKNIVNQTIKVAQLAGSVAECTQYHHGEQNLLETIIKLAQDFVGSNNIPYLYQDGQFGTRLEGGKDAAAARYIFTRLEKHMRYLFREEDEPLYTYVQVDGETVEPVYYAPILPMLLVNGCSGIGTGWSSDVPCFNPLDVMNWIIGWLDHEYEVEEKDGIEIDSTPDLVPWYKGFKGTITMEGDRAVTRGVFQPYAKKKDSYEITELPIGLWTEKYKNQVEDWYEAKQIGYRANYSTIDKVHFVVVPEEKMEMTDKNLKLISYLSLSNMVAFNTQQRIHKYKVDDLLREYCTTRLQLYEKRKAYQIKQLDHQIKVATNKIRFLTEVMKEELVLFKKTDAWVQEELVKRKYDKEEGSYSYLLHMSIQSFTAEKINEMEHQCKTLVEKQKQIKKTEPKEMWKNELNELKQVLKL